MPGFLLHMGATVNCMHGGQATPTSPSPRVLVGNQPVATQAAPWVVAGCGFVPPSGNGPCVIAQWTTAAARVTVGGQPVLLQDSQATCTPTGTGVIVASTQTRVRGS